MTRMTQMRRRPDMRFPYRCFLLAAIVVVTAAFAGCNTLQGVGKDIQRTGEKIEEVVDR